MASLTKQEYYISGSKFSFWTWNVYLYQLYLLFTKYRKKYFYLVCIGHLNDYRVSGIPKVSGHSCMDGIKSSSSFKKTYAKSMEISLKYVPYGPVENMAALVQIMAWSPTGDRPLSEPMLVCFIDAYMRHSTSMSQSAVTSHNCSVYRWTCVAQFLYDFWSQIAIWSF